MGNEEKTHWRKAFDSPYLSSADLDGPIILTIKHVKLDKDLTKRTKGLINTAYFKEKEIRPGQKLKPMWLNVGNCITVESFAGSSYISDWVDVPVTIYVNNKVDMMGAIVDGLRISSEKPQLELQELLPDNKKAWEKAVTACKRDGNLDAVLKHMCISEDNQLKIMEQSNNVG